MGTRECASAPVFGVSNRRDGASAASSSDRPRPRPPRPRSSPAGAGGSADRPGRHVPSWRLREPEPRPAQTRASLVAADAAARFFTNAIFHGRRRAWRASRRRPSQRRLFCATRAGPRRRCSRPRSAASCAAAGAAAATRTGTREEPPGRRRPWGAATAPSAPASPRTAPALTGRMASSGPGTTAAAAAARTLGRWRRRRRRRRARRDQPLDRRRVRSPGREPDVGVARGVRRRAGWVGAARGRRRAGRAPEGEADPAAAPAVVSAVASAKVLPGASSAALERLAAARAAPAWRPSRPRTRSGSSPSCPCRRERAVASLGSIPNDATYAARWACFCCTPPAPRVPTALVPTARSRHTPRRAAERR